MAVLRLLIVEDSPERQARFRSWLPEGVRAVFASSAGAALGILRLDRGRVYGGVLLDHDLSTQPAAATEPELSGQDVTGAVLDYLDRSVPVLVHSMNATGAAVMASQLQHAGFDVTVIPMVDLTHEQFLAWLEKVREAAAAVGEGVNRAGGP